MNSRERVRAAIEHRPVDRVPIDFGGHRSSGVMAIAYARLKEHLGITSGDIYVYDVIQQLAIVEPPVLDEFGIDTVEMGRGLRFELAPVFNRLSFRARSSQPFLQTPRAGPRRSLVAR